MIKDNTSGRIELKYRLNYFHYLKVLNAIAMYSKKDLFTKRAPGKGYLVRSLYFDTYDYRAYHEKMSGNCDRVKFRLRTYNQVLDDQSIIKAELKVRKANTVEKHSAIITVDEYKYFIKHRSWLEHNNPVLDEFERYLHLKDLRPKVVIEYEREGYESRFKDGVRITFDHKVRSAQADDLFLGPLFLKIHHIHEVVLEIKFQGELPQWLSQLAKNHGLRIIANSKFTQGIQVGRNDLCHPDGVVVVR